MDERKENFEEIFFSAKIVSGQALFPPLVKAKNQHQNFEKHLKQKKMRNYTFKCSKLLLFLKKNQVNMVKNVKNCYKYAIST